MECEQAAKAKETAAAEKAAALHAARPGGRGRHPHGKDWSPGSVGATATTRSQTPSLGSLCIAASEEEVSDEEDRSLSPSDRVDFEIVSTPY